MNKNTSRHRDISANSILEFFSKLDFNSHNPQLKAIQRRRNVNVFPVTSGGRPVAKRSALRSPHEQARAKLFQKLEGGGEKARSFPAF